MMILPNIIGYSNDSNLQMRFQAKKENLQFELIVLRINWEDSVKTGSTRFQVNDHMDFGLYTYKSYVFILKYKDIVKFVFLEATPDIEFMTVILKIDFSNNICCTQLEWQPYNLYRQRNCNNLSECFKERVDFINETIKENEPIDYSE